ncbi:exported protein of unknown function [Moritella yayanosii]|uniref:Uncharacterized protein n=1 Tax=Moritella yayanosii TaxID=69539 RepID=A0A330LMG6_9GAMM|nr:exported protein of unknown function [Moritella yayanosii]
MSVPRRIAGLIKWIYLYVASRSMANAAAASAPAPSSAGGSPLIMA